MSSARYRCAGELDAAENWIQVHAATPQVGAAGMRAHVGMVSTQPLQLLDGSVTRGGGRSAESTGAGLGWAAV